jgi:hypothetical protein
MTAASSPVAAHASELAKIEELSPLAVHPFSLAMTADCAPDAPQV